MVQTITKVVPAKCEWVSPNQRRALPTHLRFCSLSVPARRASRVEHPKVQLHETRKKVVPFRVAGQPRFPNDPHATSVGAARVLVTKGYACARLRRERKGVRTGASGEGTRDRKARALFQRERGAARFVAGGVA